MRYRFCEFELDEDRYELRRGERTLQLQPKALNLLLYLLRHDQQTLSKDELLDALWPGVEVTEGSLNRAAWALRHALGEHAEGGRILQTVRGRGYRIGVPVEVVQEPTRPSDPPLPDRPILVVLPFASLSEDPDQEHFADGITEDLTTVLSQGPELLVISRSSSSRYACQPADLKQVGRELGVRYAVEGSVRRAQDRVRITAQLIDATSDVHVWSESYERDLSPANVFEIQSDIAQQIANALEVQLLDWEGQRPTDDPTAWALYMRARYLLIRASTPERLLESRRLLERAIELDPGYASAHALLGVTYSAQYLFSPQRDTELLDRAETYARRSLALDPQSAPGHICLAGVLNSQGKPTEAIREARRAIELNPSDDVAHLFLGRSQMNLGRLGEAKRSFDRVQQINPRFPGFYFWVYRGTLHYLEGEIEQSVALWERARTMTSLVHPDRIMLARHYERAGRHKDARAIVQEMLSAQPELTAERGLEVLARFWNEEWIPEDLEAHLRSAGLP